MDELSHELLQRMDLQGVELLRLQELELADSGLLSVKGSRSTIEYYFTCTASLPLHIFSKDETVEQLTYLDADLFFFHSPSPIFEEIGDAPVAIVEHRFPRALKEMEQFGRFNVGWVTFRRTEVGIACLSWWRERCLEWCYDRAEPERFADQKYLDRWPDLFSGVVIIEHKGANLAPWNVANYRLTVNEQLVLVDEDPLVFFHFHALKDINGVTRDPHWTLYGLHPSRVLRRTIYGSYLRVLGQTESKAGEMTERLALSRRHVVPAVSAGRAGFVRRSGSKLSLKKSFATITKALSGGFFFHLPSRRGWTWRRFVQEGPTPLND